MLLAYLTVWHGHSGQSHNVPETVRQESDVAISGPKSIAIRPDETGIEVFSTLTDGDQVVGKGVILLKPVIAESLRLK